MRIRIVQVGKTKDSNFERTIGELEKRISGFADIEMVTLTESKVSKTFTAEMAVEQEGVEILKALKSEKNVVLLDEHGKELTSKQFAEFMAKSEDMGEPICFVIGGAFGLSEKVKAQAKCIISMSKMTFTHQMVRMFLLEQIYRGFCIIRGKEYHHE